MFVKNIASCIMPPAQQFAGEQEAGVDKSQCQFYQHPQQKYYNNVSYNPEDWDNRQDHRECQLYLDCSSQRIEASHKPRTKLLLTKNLFTFETICFLAFVILATCSLCQGLNCQTGNWWHSVQNECIKCTECKDHLIVLRPCLIYQDTICGTIHDLNIDWRPLTRTEPNWKERRKTKEQGEEMVFDWQAASLVLAAVACLIFFLAAAYISIQHMRQWRRMERRLDRDVEELSAKLMAKLAEAQNVENGGSFLIENPIKGQNVRPVEVHCVYLEKLLAGKEAQRTVPNRGNFYIEGNGSKG